MSSALRWLALPLLVAALVDSLLAEVMASFLLSEVCIATIHRKTFSHLLRELVVQ